MDTECVHHQDGLAFTSPSVPLVRADKSSYITHGRSAHYKGNLISLIAAIRRATLISDFGRDFSAIVDRVSCALPLPPLL